MDLKLTFYLLHKETSKDSSLSTISIEIAKKTIRISKKHGGHRAPEDKYEEKKINSTEEQKIIDFIEKNKLNIDLKEHRKTEALGIAQQFLFKMISPAESEISIEGKTNMWGTEKYVRKKWGRRYVKSRTNIKNIEYFSVANGFIFLIDSL